jgi:hypothetical protein
MSENRMIARMPSPEPRYRYGQTVERGDEPVRRMVSADGGNDSSWNAQQNRQDHRRKAELYGRRGALGGQRGHRSTSEK